MNKFSLPSCAYTISKSLKNLRNWFTENSFLAIDMCKGKSWINVLPMVSNKESTKNYNFHQFSWVLEKQILIWQDTPLKHVGDISLKLVKEILKNFLSQVSHKEKSQQRHIVWIGHWKLYFNLSRKPFKIMLEKGLFRFTFL